MLPPVMYLAGGNINSKGKTKFMKEELNAPISYNKAKLTYQYIESGKLCINGWVYGECRSDLFKQTAHC